MTKLIALSIGMTGTFYGAAGHGQRAEITRIWSETCVNLKVTGVPAVGAFEQTSVFVPPLDTPATRHPAGYYFLPDVFVADALRQEEVDSLHESDLEASTGTEGPVAAQPSRVMSFGEKAVGLQFNPSNQAAVYQCKSRFAELIDQLDTRRHTDSDPEVKRLCSIAITEAQTAQMWAVKALTWES